MTTTQTETTGNGKASGVKPKVAAAEAFDLGGHLKELKSIKASVGVSALTLYGLDQLQPHIVRGVEMLAEVAKANGFVLPEAVTVFPELLDDLIARQASQLFSLLCDEGGKQADLLDELDQLRNDDEFESALREVAENRLGVASSK
ncbi:MAG: hypothetical protein RLZZ324_99 [Candidatus Parcubacteria bacterium]|jgi:hypothetical protein